VIIFTSVNIVTNAKGDGVGGGDGGSDDGGDGW
jgi:hypothetical protein